MKNKFDLSSSPINITQTQKSCSLCKKHKKTEDFYTKGSRYSSRCKQCDLKKKKEKKYLIKKRNKTCTTRRNLDLESAFVVLSGCPGNLRQINSAINDFCKWTIKYGEENGK